MIELHIGNAHSSEQPRFVFPENGMPPEIQIQWARNLIQAYGIPEKKVVVSTYSPLIIGVLNNGLAAHQAGRVVDTPALDPQQLRVVVHDGKTVRNGYDAEFNAIDTRLLDEASEAVVLEFSEFQV